MVISFLVLWSICLSSFLFHFTKGPEYLARGTAQVFMIFTNPSARVGYDTRFNRFEFSFPSPRLVTSPRLKNRFCPTVYCFSGGRIIGFIPFPRVSVLCNQSRPGFELVSPCPFPTAITITPRAPFSAQVFIPLIRFLQDSLRVVVLMRHHCLRYRQVLFLHFS